MKKPVSVLEKMSQENKLPFHGVMSILGCVSDYVCNASSFEQAKIMYHEASSSGDEEKMIIILDKMIELTDSFTLSSFYTNLGDDLNLNPFVPYSFLKKLAELCIKELESEIRVSEAEIIFESCPSVMNYKLIAFEKWLNLLNSKEQVMEAYESNEHFIEEIDEAKFVILSKLATFY